MYSGILINIDNIQAKKGELMLSDAELNKYKKLDIQLIHESNFPEILCDLEKNLGNIDNGIREGCLDIIWNLVDSGKLSDEIYIALGNRMVDNLNYEIGFKCADSVFLRTFSAIIIGLIIAIDEIRRLSNTKPFLTNEIFQSWFNAGKKYFMDEIDYRGYIQGKGWSHSISHSADLLRDCAFHSFSTKDQHVEILDLLSEKLVKNGEYTFIYNDDNRLSRIVIVIMFRRTLNVYDYEKWITKIIDKFEGNSWFYFTPNQSKSIVWFNTITFFRALYMVLSFGMKNIYEIPCFDNKPPLSEEVKALVISHLKKMDDGLNYPV